MPRHCQVSARACPGIVAARLAATGRSRVRRGGRSRGGRVLIPAFALGRSQELLLILDEYWSAHPELHSVPIYYASALAKKCMAVYQTYVKYMNNRIRAVANPFVFKHVSALGSLDNFDDIGPVVVMARWGAHSLGRGPGERPH